MTTGEDRRNRLRIRLRPVPMMQFVRRVRTPAPVKDPGNDPRHLSSPVLRLVRRLPVVVVNAPERVVLITGGGGGLGGAVARLLTEEGSYRVALVDNRRDALESVEADAVTLSDGGVLIAGGGIDAEALIYR